MSGADIQMEFPELFRLLYHGSDSRFSAIDLSKSALKKDFGCGFYTTNSKDQAEKFARLKAKRSGLSKGFVEVFRFCDTEGLKIKKHDSADEEWFDFVLQNRGHIELASKGELGRFDIVIGPVANDAVGLVLNQYISGAFGDPFSTEAKATAIRLLLTQTLSNQVFFGTDLAVSSLSFVEVYDVLLD